jgi:hypothetical protein
MSQKHHLIFCLGWLAQLLQCGMGVVYELVQEDDNNDNWAEWYCIPCHPSCFLSSSYLFFLFFGWQLSCFSFTLTLPPNLFFQTFAALFKKWPWWCASCWPVAVYPLVQSSPWTFCFSLDLCSLRVFPLYHECVKRFNFAVGRNQRIGNYGYLCKGTEQCTQPLDCETWTWTEKEKVR